MTWTGRRILDLFGIGLPILQAPMAGSTMPERVLAVSAAGGLGSPPCALAREMPAGALARRRAAEGPGGTPPA